MIRKRQHLLILAITLPIALFVLAALAIVASGLRDHLGPADVAIVLGNQVEASGRPSLRLQARLDKCAEVYKKGLVPWVIVSGGVGKEGFDEAVVMRRTLIDRGIPAERIIVDSAGVNTYATARNAARIMRERHMKSALVVTQYYHIPRSCLALRRVGVATVYSVHASLFEWRDFYSVSREVAGYLVYFVRKYE